MPNIPPPPATAPAAGGALIAFKPSISPTAANNIVRFLRANSLPVPPPAAMSVLERWVAGAAPILRSAAKAVVPIVEAAGMALSLGGDTRQTTTDPLALLARSGAKLDSAFELLNDRIIQTTGWPDIKGERAAMQSYLSMARQTIQELAADHPQQAAAALAALFQLHGFGSSAQDITRLKQLASAILARSGLTQPAQTIQAQQTHNAFATALQQARTVNEQLSGIQSQAAQLQAQAQKLMRLYQQQATGGMAARSKLSQTAAKLEGILGELRALYNQANTPVAALKQAAQRMQKISEKAGAGTLAPETTEAQQLVAQRAKAGDAFRSNLSARINETLAPWLKQAYSYLINLKASASTAPDKKPSGLSATFATIRKVSEYAPESPERTPAPARTHEEFQRRVLPLLGPHEQQQWEKYAENNPDIVTIVREAAREASDGDRAEAVRALLNGAYGHDVVAWLRAGGIGSGRLPPHRPMRAPAISPEGPRRPYGAQGKVRTGPPLVTQARLLDSRETVRPPAPARQVIRWGMQAGLPLFPWSLPFPVHSGKLALRIWRDNTEKPPQLPAELLLRGLPLVTPTATFATFLAKWLPEGMSMRLAIFPPAPAALQTLSGRTRQHSLRVDIDEGLKTGAIVVKPDGELTLNLRETPEGPTLLVPLKVSIVDDVEFEPTNIPLIQSFSPLHITFKRQQLHVWTTELRGHAPPSIIAAITRTLKRGHFGGSEVWLTPQGGANWFSRSYFAPSSLPVGLYQRLPRDWEKLGLLAMIPPDRLKTPDEILKSYWLGLGHGMLTFYRQTIDSHPGHHSPPIFPLSDIQQPRSAGQRLPRLLFVPSSADSPSRIEVRATGSETPAEVLGGGRMDPNAVMSLVFPDAGMSTMSIRGAVLNALRGHVVEVADLPAMTEFLRNLDGAAHGRGSYRGWSHLNVRLVYEILSTLQPGQALPKESIDAIHLGIQKFFESLPSSSGSLNLPAP